MDINNNKDINYFDFLSFIVSASVKYDKDTNAILARMILRFRETKYRVKDGVKCGYGFQIRKSNTKAQIERLLKNLCLSIQQVYYAELAKNKANQSIMLDEAFSNAVKRLKKELKHDISKLSKQLI